MKVTGLNHITINVKDLGQSQEFYKGVLNLDEAGFIDMGDHTLTYFQLPQGIRLELIDYQIKEQAGLVKETATGIYRHFCLEADNLDEMYQLCQQKGVEVRKKPSYVEELSCSTMLLVDPNGVEIEIIQR